MTAPYPWLQSAWDSLLGALAGDRLGHAYLVCGPHGLGKLELVEKFAGLVLCEARGAAAQACGACRGCALYASGNHPDLRVLQPEEERKSILVDQVRDLIEFYALKSHYHGHKPAIVYPADSMNHAAANALLKLLEEPPAGALLLLVAHRPGLLPATVVSRCQRLGVTMPDWPERAAWLAAQLAGDAALAGLAELSVSGAPLDMLREVRAGRGGLLNDIIADLDDGQHKGWDALAATRRFAEIDARAFIDALETSVQAAALLAAGETPRHLVLAPAARERLQHIANNLNLGRLVRFLDRIGEARALVLRSSGVRGVEVIENLWFSWGRASHTETAG